MSYDGITTKAIVKELQSIVNFRINKINQPYPNEIILTIGKVDKNKVLFSSNSSSPRVHFVDTTPENPMTPPNFCMVLRKHLQGGFIQRVYQHKLDRIIIIEVSSKDELGYNTSKYLVTELMGKHSNIILLDSDKERVIDSIKRVNLDMSSVRQVYPGSKYRFIEDDKFDILSQDNLPSSLIDSESDKKVSQIFHKSYTGFSPEIGLELLFRSKIDLDTRMSNIEKNSLDLLDKEFIKLCDSIKDEEFKAHMHYNDERSKILSYYPFRLCHLGSSYKESDSLSELIEEYYENTINTDKINQKTQNLIKLVQVKLKRDQNKYVNLDKDLSKAIDRDKYKVYADVLSANIHKVEKGAKSIVLENFYSEEMEEIEIPLDYKKSAIDNAQSFYKTYSKMKKRESVLKEEIPKLKEEISYLEQVIHTLKQITEVSEADEIKEELENEGILKKRFRKKAPKLKPSQALTFTSREGANILVGKNNKQNDELTLKIASKNDIFFHIQGLPGSHVILKTDNVKITDKSIQDAAYLAAKYSSQGDEKLVTIDYTERKNVYKAKGAKPGMVYYKNYSSIVVDLSQKDFRL